MRYTKEQRFKKHVLSRYQIYNSIFMTLPFDAITKTGALLPLFQEVCERGFKAQKNPTEIVHEFFGKYTETTSEETQINLLFRFIQYIERQVVLFDAVEDAAFTTVNNMEGRGTLRNSKEEAEDKNKLQELRDYLEHFKVRPVLTAHPTQFYPGAVLGIITDLAKAIEETDLELIKNLLAQLGKTPFFKKQKPTPYDEAVSLIWYLENVFYDAASSIYNYIQSHIFEGDSPGNEIVQLGFWPGGDRDGNPFVTPEITLNVAGRLRSTILKNYYKDIRALRRRITFSGVDVIVLRLETEVYANISRPHGKVTISASHIIEELQTVKELLIEKHQSLFVEMVDDLLNKLQLFGLHFATLDIRQDSRIHGAVMEAIAKDSPQLFPDNYAELEASEKVALLSKIGGDIAPESIGDELAQKTLASVRAMKIIQENNGEAGCNRYIISNNQTVQNVLEAFALLRLSNWHEPTVDVVPLFETVDDLEVAGEVMEELYANPIYAAHLKRRGMRQTIMLGFSDGTKDGGYLMANWGIYTAKERLTAVGKKYGIAVIFFDGRGGPPARGGGKTHQFYASLGPTIAKEEVQLTIQGQTISSNFGTQESCQFNLEQLLSSGISNAVFSDDKDELNDTDRQTLNQLAGLSYEAYSDFKAHPKFLPYLEQISTLRYYAMTNIGSRPSKRGKSSELVFSDLRAIPFVGSWSQLKQNVPGFYGVGHALEVFKSKGEFDKVVSLYNNSAFFRTLLENSMMSLSKSFFPLTAYMKDDPEFGAFWSLIHKEYQRSKSLLLELTGYTELMEDSKAKIGRAHV